MWSEIKFLVDDRDDVTAVELHGIDHFVKDVVHPLLLLFGVVGCTP